jgi:hypothetical protein
MTEGGMTSGPKRQITFATFGKGLLCLYASALVYRYHRNTTPTDEHIKNQRAMIRKEYPQLMSGPYQELSNDLEFERIDLGIASAIGFSDDGTLLYAKVVSPKARIGDTPDAIFLRAPNGSTKGLAYRPSAIFADGRVVQLMDNHVQIDGKPLALKEPYLSPEGTAFSNDEVFAAGRNFCVSSYYRTHLVTDQGNVSLVGKMEPADESPLIAAARILGIFNSTTRNQYPDNLQISASGTLYGSNLENDSLYNDRRGSRTIIYRSKGEAYAVVPMPSEFRPNYTDPQVTLDDTLVVHRSSPQDLQYWPHFLVDGKLEPIALPAGTQSGKVLTTADANSMLMQCGKSGYGGELYLRKDGKLYALMQWTKDLGTDWSVPNPNSGGPYRSGRRWVSKTGAFVAQNKGRAYLFIPKTKTKSP